MAFGEKIAQTEKVVGQAYVEQVSRKALRDIQVNFDNNTSYLTEVLPDLTGVENSTMSDYRGRYIFELLQNANDAILSHREEAKEARKKKYRVHIELTASALIVANDGTPFLEKDVDSIYRWGESSKDPNKSIGYKGIGFKSVLEITSAPQIFSSVVQFHFNRELCYQKVREIVGDFPDLELPFTRYIFPFSLDEIANPDRDIVAKLLGQEGYASVIRLPLNPE